MVTESAKPTVYIIDADDSLRRDHPTVLASESIQTIRFSKPSQIMTLAALERPSCAICHLNVGDMVAESLQITLNKRRSKLPMFFIGRAPAFSMAIRLMERGAVTVIESPCPSELLQHYIANAISLDRQQIAFDQLYESVNGAIQHMTERQRQVLHFVVQGMSTKQIALELGYSERLIEKERSTILALFSVSSTSDVTLRLGGYRILESIYLRNDSANRSFFRSSVRSLHSSKADT